MRNITVLYSLMTKTDEGSETEEYMPRIVGVFCTNKMQGVQDRAFLFRDGLANYQHTKIYPGSDPSLKVIALHPLV
jgi:hypothetical protein